MDQYLREILDREFWLGLHAGGLVGLVWISVCQQRIFCLYSQLQDTATEPPGQLAEYKVAWGGTIYSVPDLLSLVEPSLFMDLLELMDMSPTWEGFLMHSQTAFQCCWAASSTCTDFFSPFPPRVYLPCSPHISLAASGSQRAVTGVSKYGRINPLYFCILRPSNLESWVLQFPAQLAFMLFSKRVLPKYQQWPQLFVGLAQLCSQWSSQNNCNI